LFASVKRCNPLKLWLWDNHVEEKKNHFFGKKDDVYARPLSSVVSPVDGTTSRSDQVKITQPGTSDVPEESYIVKTINSEAPVSKVFDNAQIVMTPKHVDYSFIDYTTDITHDTITAKSVLDNKTELLDETEQLVINRRWDFGTTTHGWSFYNGSLYMGMTLPSDEAVQLVYDGDGRFRSPDNKGGLAINVPGKYNNIIRMRVKRTVNGSNWEGKVYWTGYDPVRKAEGNLVRLYEIESRSLAIDEPAGIDDDYVIIEWDMSNVGDANGTWNDCIIEQIRIDLSDTTVSTFLVDWIEIGGLKADKYLDGVLRLPLRTEKSKRRTRGTYAKIKYSAKTTEKFNIFAILAKYRRTY
jgi:hypothetical protein